MPKLGDRAVSARRSLKARRPGGDAEHRGDDAAGGVAPVGLAEHRLTCRGAPRRASPSSWTFPSSSRWRRPTPPARSASTRAEGSRGRAVRRPGPAAPTPPPRSRAAAARAARDAIGGPASLMAPRSQPSGGLPIPPKPSAAGRRPREPGPRTSRHHRVLEPAVSLRCLRHSCPGVGDVTELSSLQAPLGRPTTPRPAPPVTSTRRRPWDALQEVRVDESVVVRVETTILPVCAPGRRVLTIQRGFQFWDVGLVSEREVEFGPGPTMRTLWRHAGPRDTPGSTSSACCGSRGRQASPPSRAATTPPVGAGLGR